MISSALAIRDLRALRTVDPELTLRLLSPGYEVLDITSDVAEAHSNEQQEQEESAFSIAKIRIVSQALAHIIAMVGSAVSLVGRLLIRLLANPYVAGALAVATVGFGVFKWIKNKLNPVETYPALSSEQQQEYLQSLGYPAGTTYADIKPQKIQDYSKHLKTTPIINYVVQGAERVGVDPQLMLQIVKAESAFGANTAQSASSAKGIFQIIDSTWRENYSKFNQKYGIPVNSPLDPLSASIFSAAYVKDVIMKYLPSNPTATDVYMSYVFGPGGGPTLVKAYRANPLGTSIQAYADRYGWSSANSVARANRNYFYRNGRPMTLAETYAVAQSRVTFTKSEQFILNSRLPDVIEEPEEVETVNKSPSGIGMDKPKQLVRVGQRYIEVDND